MNTQVKINFDVKKRKSKIDLIPLNSSVDWILLCIINLRYIILLRVLFLFIVKLTNIQRLFTHKWVMSNCDVGIFFEYMNLMDSYIKVEYFLNM